MSAEFVQCGDAIDYTPPADTGAGSVIVLGELVGVTKHDIRANTLGSIAVVGVFDIDKDAAIAIAAGDKVYWNQTNTQAVTTATGNKLLGKAVAAAAVNAPTVRVRLSQ